MQIIRKSLGVLWWRIKISRCIMHRFTIHTYSYTIYRNDNISSLKRKVKIIIKKSWYEHYIIKYIFSIDGTFMSISSFIVS